MTEFSDRQFSIRADSSPFQLDVDSFLADRIVDFGIEFTSSIGRLPFQPFRRSMTGIFHRSRKQARTLLFIRSPASTFASLSLGKRISDSPTYLENRVYSRSSLERLTQQTFLTQICLVKYFTKRAKNERRTSEERDEKGNFIRIFHHYRRAIR